MLETSTSSAGVSAACFLQEATASSALWPGSPEVCWVKFAVCASVQAAGSPLVAENSIASVIWSSSSLLSSLLSSPPQAASTKTDASAAISSASLRMSGISPPGSRGRSRLYSAAGGRRALLGAKLGDVGIAARLALGVCELALELGDAIGELLDRFGDRVGQVNPVGI